MQFERWRCDCPVNAQIQPRDQFVDALGASQIRRKNPAGKTYALAIFIDPPVVDSGLLNFERTHTCLNRPGRQMLDHQYNYRLRETFFFDILNGPPFVTVPGARRGERSRHNYLSRLYLQNQKQRWTKVALTRNIPRRNNPGAGIHRQPGKNGKKSFWQGRDACTISCFGEIRTETSERALRWRPMRIGRQAQDIWT